LRAPSLAELSKLDDVAFRALFTKSPVKRIGRNRFLRNVLIAIGNSGDATLIDDAKRALRDESPLVRSSAVWALAQLAPEHFEEIRSMHIDSESDSDVRAEWHDAKRGVAASPVAP
jgi:epoxyqueuosine reductase